MSITVTEYGKLVVQIHESTGLSVIEITDRIALIAQTSIYIQTQIAYMVLENIQAGTSNPFAITVREQAHQHVLDYFKNNSKTRE